MLAIANTTAAAEIGSFRTKHKLQDIVAVDARAACTHRDMTRPQIWMTRK
jgi:hypothetical protein